MTDAPFGPEKIAPEKTDGTALDEEANDFAATILLPENAFRHDAVERGLAPSELAELYGVPEGAIHRRMAMLHIAGHAIEDTSRWETKH